MEDDSDDANPLQTAYDAGFDEGINTLRKEIAASAAIRMIPEIQSGWAQAHDHILALLDKVQTGVIRSISTTESR